MALGVRGSSPIWSLVDLQGKQFDDTFFLFVLQNEIPYTPESVFHDAAMMVPWTNPIQFLGNGTLPVDIYFAPNTLYRLEFRQGNTQEAPLIYEVNNYPPEDGGGGSIDTVALASDNQITNPQFALFSAQSPTVIAGTDPDPIVLAPGWELLLGGTGTATINQVALNNANTNPSNAPYALRLTLTGWTTGTVILRQRFLQNGMLWANKIVSSAITASLTGEPQSITATLVDSNNSVLGTVLGASTINETWNEYTGYAELPATTNPDVPPSAYIDYLLYLPSNVDIYLTSLQLVAQDLPFEPSFQPDSLQRQIDHTYHHAYPIVPVGAIIDFGGFVVPEHFYLCDGAQKNRVSNYLLFSTLTTIETVTLTSGINTFTVASNVNYHIGMDIEGDGIPAATTISNISGTTITMSANATASGAKAVTFFAWGGGDGSTTFNLPDFQGFASAGAGGSLFSGVNGVGLSGGTATETISEAQMPAHNHASSSGNFLIDIATGGNIAVDPGGNAVNQGTTANTGGGEAHNNVQPTKLVKKCIRYQ